MTANDPARPSRFDIEAYHAGESRPEVEAWLGSHPEEQASIDALNQQQARFLERETPDDFARRIRHASDDHRSPSTPFWRRFVAPLTMIAAAGICLVVVYQQQSTGNGVIPGQETQSGLLSEPQVLYKGKSFLSVVIRQNGHSRRYTQAPPLRTGDELRVELNVTEKGQFSVGILEKDTWKMLLENQMFEPGSHVLKGSFLVDEKEMDATVYAGPSKALERARKDGVYKRLSSLKLRMVRPR